MPHHPTRDPSRYSTMHNRLTTEIERIRSDKSIPTLDEASVKQGVILRILHALGWDTFDIEEVRPEHSVGSRRVDYALRPDGRNKVFLEAKRPNEDLSNHAPQLLDYSFREGVSLATLTNGLNWWFYLPLREGSWEERRFGVIDLRNQDVSQTTDSLIDFLSRENVRSGTAVENAESHLAKLWKARKTEEILPKAWEQVITDLDDILVELLSEKVEEMCGWQPDVDQVKRFLTDSLNPTPAQSFSTSLPTPPQPSMQGLGVQYRRKSKGPSPVSFTFCGERFGVKTWGELLTTLAQVIYERHPNEFGKVSTLGGWHPITDSFPKTRPKPIGDSGWSVPTNTGKDKTNAMLYQLLTRFGYRQQDLQIETA